jgi:hypothetical protein
VIRKTKKNQIFFRFSAVLASLLVFIITFQIFAAIQSSTVKEQKKLDEEFRINQIEVQKIIDSGVANFTPGPQAIEWPGCQKPRGRELTPLEMGYCDGASLSYSWIGSSTYDSTEVPKIIESYQNLVTSRNQSAEVCELATERSNWKNVLYNHPLYRNYEPGFILKDSIKSQYKEGCKLGIYKNFALGKSEYRRLQNQLERQKIRESEKSVVPSPTSTQTGGYWVSKCRYVQVPNPNYIGGQTSVNQNIERPRYVTQEQCTDVYVSK